MNYTRNHNYYESSRSRSRDRKYRRDAGFREEVDRYGAVIPIVAHSSVDYNSAAVYRRSAQRPQPVHHPHQHELPFPGGPYHHPPGKVVLAVFNLSIYTTEAELYEVFSKFGPIRKATVVLDAKSGRSRGFGFVYFESAEDAKVAHEQANGIEIGDRRIRVDFSATDKPHDPTPGVYYGKVSYPKGGGPPVGPPQAMPATSGYHHCRACEVEARERERWEREARISSSYRDQYYYEKYPTERIRDRSAMAPRPRNDYYRSGTSIR